MKKAPGTPCSKRIQQLRSEQHITQKQLAQETGLSYSSIIGYENGKREPNSKAMAALERYFNVSGEYLRGESEERQGGYQWDDAEIMVAVRESFPKQLADLNDILKRCSAKEQKQIFNILVQLHRVLLLKDTSKRQTALSMIHEVAVAVERLTSDQPKSTPMDKPTTHETDCL